MGESFRDVLKKWEEKEKREEEYKLLLYNSEKVLKKIFAKRNICLNINNKRKRFTRKK